MGSNSSPKKINLRQYNNKPRVLIPSTPSAYPTSDSLNLKTLEGKPPAVTNINPNRIITPYDKNTSAIFKDAKTVRWLNNSGTPKTPKNNIVRQSQRLNS